MEKPLILVIDDEVKQTDMIAKLVEETENYRVMKAYNAIEALEILKKNKSWFGPNKIKLILLDIKMPEMDGLQFLDKIRHDYAEDQIGVIMLTAYEDEDKWDKATAGFVVDYIKKPVVEEKLLFAIDKFFSSEEARVKMTLDTFDKHIQKREEFKEKQD
ncbi:MAG: response regulator [Candidatus Margulisbacteria bacterium]|nr:response regulator [Candidatus Margulisiibacteriota bacterium]